MGKIDLFYRALKEYRKNTLENRDFAARRKALAESNTETDLVTVVVTNCIIDEDWVDAIEKGLVFIEKAISEERQFIRSNGEVIPIEKVKQVSRDSVEHLAKHSDLLTRENEGSDIIPDKLYTVERLSDYAVYENRFLYFLLCYLRDFISFRYNKIVEYTNTYNGHLTMRKQSVTPDRRTVFEVQLDEEVKNDEYLKEHNPAKFLIDRIDIMLKTVMSFLATPLMEDVAKAPMIKPPITETNVLRMNKNFKGAKECYYFVSSYTKQGYTIERTTKVLNPFDELSADEFAEAVMLMSFLTYEHGLGIEKQLKINYEEQEELKRQEEKKRQLERLEALRRRIKQNGGTDEEYMLLLEQRNKALEDDSAQLTLARGEIERLNGEVEKLNGHINSLNGIIEAKDGDIRRIRDEQVQRIAEINAAHAEEIGEINRANEENIANIARENEEYIKNLNERNSREISEINERFGQEKQRLEGEILKNRQETAEKQREIEEKARLLDRITEEKRFSEARLNALRQKNGLLTAADDFTSEASFNEIEMQYEAFRNFFKTQWRATKKKIRRELLTKENIIEASKKKPKDAPEGQGDNNGNK